MNYWGPIARDLFENIDEYWVTFPMKNLKTKKKNQTQTKAGRWRLVCLLLWCLHESVSSEVLPRVIHFHSMMYTFHLGPYILYICILTKKGSILSPRNSRTITLLCLRFFDEIWIVVVGHGGWVGVTVDNGVFIPLSSLFIFFQIVPYTIFILCVFFNKIKTKIAYKKRKKNYSTKRN